MDSLLAGPLMGPVGCNACILCGKPEHRVFCCGQNNAYFVDLSSGPEGGWAKTKRGQTLNACPSKGLKHKRQRG